MAFLTPFRALVRKDLILFVSDRRALLVNLLLPIVIGTFFGYLFGGAGHGGAGRVEVALVQQDSGAIATAVASALSADPSIAVTALDAGQAREQVRKGRQKVAVIIPKGFGDAAGAALFGAGDKPAIALLYDPSQQAVLSMVKGILSQHVMQAVSADMMGGAGGEAFTKKSLARLDDKGDADSAALREMLASVNRFQHRAGAPGAAAPAKGGMSMPFATTDEAVKSGSAVDGYNGYAHAFAGMGVQFILFMGIDIGIGILLSRRSGIWQRLMAAPVTLRTVLLARAASAAIISLALLCAIFGFAVAVLGVRINNLPGFAGVALCFALLTAAFGLFIAAFGKTPEAARGIALFATLIMVMLGGAWVPSFLFPAWVQKVSLLVPTRWAIDGFDAMTWRGLGMDAALESMAVQLAFALVFGALALWKFARRQG